MHLPPGVIHMTAKVLQCIVGLIVTPQLERQGCLVYGQRCDMLKTVQLGGGFFLFFFFFYHLGTLSTPDMV